MQKHSYVCPASIPLSFSRPMICAGSFKGGHRPAEPGGSIEESAPGSTGGGGAGSAGFGGTWEEEP